MLNMNQFSFPLFQNHLCAPNKSFVAAEAVQIRGLVAAICHIMCLSLYQEHCIACFSGGVMMNCATTLMFGSYAPTNYRHGCWGRCLYETFKPHQGGIHVEILLHQCSNFYIVEGFNPGIKPCTVYSTKGICSWYPWSIPLINPQSTVSWHSSDLSGMLIKISIKMSIKCWYQSTLDPRYLKYTQSLPALGSYNTNFQEYTRW